MDRRARRSKSGSPIYQFRCGIICTQRIILLNYMRTATASARSWGLSRRCRAVFGVRGVRGMASPAPWEGQVLQALEANKELRHSTYYQIATVSPSGRPSNRTVVFRGFLPGSKLSFVTDHRCGLGLRNAHQWCPCSPPSHRISGSFMSSLPPWLPQEQQDPGSRQQPLDRSCLVPPGHAGAVSLFWIGRGRECINAGERAAAGKGVATAGCRGG